MLKRIPTAPPDAIFGLSEAFKADPRPEKINLVAGVWQDEAGATPILAAVKIAEKQLLETECDKAYLPIEGGADYGKAVRKLLLGEEHAALDGGRAVTAQTPGGTGALRVFADLLARQSPGSRIWLSNVTWANHPKIFTDAGLKVGTYDYFDAAGGGLDFAAMIASLEEAAPGDVVLVQAVCHNPSGVDLSAIEWHKLAEIFAERELFPLFDIAYQGFGDDLEKDAAGLRHLTETLPEAAICSSFSKILGLYNERVGALTVLAETGEEAQATLSQVRTAIRTNYSNPPAHGAAIAALVLTDADLRQRWESELATMRERIASVRRLFVERLDRRGISLRPAGNDFITKQRGMFSFVGLTQPQVDWLREERSVYMASAGRINVAGINDDNVERLVDAIADCLAAEVS